VSKLQQNKLVTFLRHGVEEPSLEVAPTTLSTFFFLALNFDLWPCHTNLTQTRSSGTTGPNIEVVSYYSVRNLFSGRTQTHPHSRPSALHGHWRGRYKVGNCPRAWQYWCQRRLHPFTAAYCVVGAVRKFTQFSWCPNRMHNRRLHGINMFQTGQGRVRAEVSPGRPGLKLSARVGPLPYWRRSAAGGSSLRAVILSSFNQNCNKFPGHCHRCIIADDWLEVCQCKRHIWYFYDAPPSVTVAICKARSLYLRYFLTSPRQIEVNRTR